MGWNCGKPNREVWAGPRCTPVDLKMIVVGSVVKGLSPSSMCKGYNGCSGDVVMDGSNECKKRGCGTWKVPFTVRLSVEAWVASLVALQHCCCLPQD